MIIKLFFLLLTIFNGIVGTSEIDLRSYEIRRISQHVEDGFIEKIFQLIGTDDKYYVEFGAGDEHFCSHVKYLREHYGKILTINKKYKFCFKMGGHLGLERDAVLVAYL